MRQVLAVVVLVMAVALASCGGGAKEDVPADVPTDYYAPTSYVAGQPTPLVVFLHGYNSTVPDVVPNYMAWLQLVAAAEARGVLLALPRAAKAPGGGRAWNGAGCCSAVRDDVAFLQGVVAEAKARYAVDPKRVYFLGHSNGAFMAHRMGCDAAGTTAAVVAISGDTYAQVALCQPTAPVAVLQVHGNADRSVPYLGNGTWPSAPASVATWAALNGCGTSLVDTGVRLQLDNSVAGAATRVEAHACPAGAAELWTMAGSRHEPNFPEPSATETLIDWLLAHPKP